MRVLASSRVIYLGGLPIGGGNPISVQSMLRSSLNDLESCISEGWRLLDKGCEVIRVALYSEDQLENLSRLKKALKAPLVADVHFVPELAIKALLSGADGVRINPGNMKDVGAIRELAKVAKKEDKVVRIGVNLGSVPYERRKACGDDAQAMVGLALETLRIFEEVGCENIKISLKASDVITTVRAYRLISKLTDYPLHLGITEAGPVWEGSIRSAVGLGILLSEGIGDTIRVSLTGDGVKEVEAAYEILRALGLRKFGVEIISCPRCGRCEIDLESMVEEVKRRTSNIKKYIKVAIMGCVVNGPGEARDADVGIAGGKGRGVVFRKGEMVCVVDESKLVDKLLELIKEVEGDENE